MSKMIRAKQYQFINEFLTTNYEFRFNCLSGKLEFNQLGGSQDFLPLTEFSLNSIVHKANIELPDEVKSIKEKIRESIYSIDTPQFDPIWTYLNGLTSWGGQDHVKSLLNRIPGLNFIQEEWFKIWLRGMVNQWMNENTEHGNEAVPVLIGAQGCGKSTFFQRLLPPELRVYYLDHLNLGNKFDKDMALTNNLLVNLDELDQYKNSKTAELKQALSKVKVTGRAIFGRVQEDRRRYSSIVATTNNPHPLQDPTGSRRFIIAKIEKGKNIDNSGDIDYEQLYAQIKYELKHGLPYWFDSNEVQSIEKANQQYYACIDLAQIFELTFKQPEESTTKATPVSDIATKLIAMYPNLTKDKDLHYHIGCKLRDLGFEKKKTNRGTSYVVEYR